MKRNLTTAIVLAFLCTLFVGGLAVVNTGCDINLTQLTDLLDDDGLGTTDFDDDLDSTDFDDDGSGTQDQDQGPQGTALGDGHMVYNVTDDFIAYAEQASGDDAAGRQTKWDQMLEGKWLAFFNDVLYRGLTGQDRENYKSQIIDQFWNEIVPKLDTLKQVNSTAAQKTLDGRTTFQNMFTDFDPKADYYLTVAFSFHGKAVEVAGQPALALGLENFAPDEPELDITIAHEQFHLYHFTTFDAAGGLYRGVWAEGMAVYASTVVLPGYRMTQYLGFTGEQVDSMWNLFDDLTADIRNNLSSSDQTIKRAYLGVEPNDTWIPPGSGYYIGFYVVDALVKEGNTLADLTRWDKDTVYQNMDRILPTLQQP